MNQIDLTRLISAEEIAEQTSSVRIQTIKADCQTQILAVMDRTAQMNLTAAAAAGLMDETQYQVWIETLRWIQKMRATCAEYASQAMVIDLQTLTWPAAPEGAVELSQTG